MTWRAISMPTTKPSAAFQAQCDVTQGGSRIFCDQLVTNPFFGVAGFEGTNRFTEPDDLPVRAGSPVPGVHRPQQEPEPERRQLTYDSMQFVANKRWAKGVTINASYTYVPRWTESRCEHYDWHRQRLRRRVSLLQNDRPCISRSASTASPASGVWELPWYRDQQEHRRLPARRVVDRAGGRSISRASRGHARITSTWRRASIRR